MTLFNCMRHLGIRTGWRYWKIARTARKLGPAYIVAWANRCRQEAQTTEDKRWKDALLDWSSQLEKCVQEPKYTGKWQVSTMECMACGTIQASLHPVTCEYLECHMCHRLMPAPFLEESLEK